MNLSLATSIKTLLTVASLGIFVATTTATAGQSGDEKFSHTASEEIQWGPTPFGPEAASIAGDFASGQHITFIKFAAGMATPLHTHSHDYVGLVVSGITRHWVHGKQKTQKLLPPGSYWSIPANVEHVSECLDGDDCVMAIFQSQAFDFIPVNKQ